MAKLLAIETCTEACSVALWDEGLVAAADLVEPRAHADQLLTMVDSVLTRGGYALAELDGIVVGQGPGSFTGVRIGIAAAQGLAFGADLLMAPVSSLHAMALVCHQESGAENVCCAFDARMGEVYCAAYRFEEGLGVPVLAEHVGDPGSIALPEGMWVGVGSGFATYHDLLTADNRFAYTRSDYYPSAAAAAQIASAKLSSLLVAPELVQARYLRNRVTQGAQVA